MPSFKSCCSETNTINDETDFCIGSGCLWYYGNEYYEGVVRDFHPTKKNLSFGPRQGNVDSTNKKKQITKFI